MRSDPPTPEEINPINGEALEELAWAIDNSAGSFALLLARCNYASLRDQLVAELQQRFPDQRVLTVPPDTTTLFATIRDELGGEQPAVLHIFGLEAVTAIDPLLSSTNQVREEFRKNFPFPLVLWVTDEVLQRLTRLAPDFESWATTTDFTFDTSTLTRSLQAGADHLFETLLTPDSNLSFNRLLRQLNFGQLRLAELGAALRELHHRGQTLAPDIRASLEFFQGVMNPDRTAAIASFQRSLAFWESQMQTAINSATSKPETRILPDLKAGLLRFYIGQFLYYRVYRDDERSTDWETTRQYLTQAIALFDRANRPDLAAKCTIHLQRVLERIGEWAELDTLARRSLGLYQTYGTLSRLIQNYRYLAVAAIHRQDWTTACEYAQQAWDWLAQVPEDQHWQGLYLLTRAQAQLGAGNRDEAIHLLEQAHQLGDQGHPQVYTGILEELRQIYRSQQRYLEAFRLKQERQSIEQQYGIRAFVGAGRLQPKREDRDALTQPLRLATTEDEIALEIRASGRQKDLEQLLERIGRNDYKLIVIHGYSGVGKSSLVNAGLVAALKQKPIALRRNLPIVVRTYTDWEGELGRLLVEAIGGSGTAEQEGVLEQLRWLEGQNRRSVLIFDQFEEFFFVYPQPEERRSFFRFLAECLQILSVKVVLALREDYLHFLLECHQLPEMERTGIDILGRNVRYGLGNFAPTDAAAIIDNLTSRARFYLEPELQDTLVADLAGELGQVRPIELQIVGAQLQADNITTLAQYRQLGDNPKQMLVERYLAEVVNDCGEEHSRLAELVLYLLTDEKGTRPLKTRKDLEKELPALAKEPEQISLNLVLDIVVNSGLVMLLPEVPEDRYQLVHDYLAAFIRQQQEPRLSVLIAELEQEREQRRQAETQRQKTLLELGQVQQALAEAQQNLDAVTLKVKLAQQQLAQARQEQERAETAVRLAEAKQAEAQQGTQLEQAGVVALRAIEFSPFVGLLEAMRTGISLQKIVRDGRPLEQYPAISPLLALRSTLDTVQEKNQFKGHQSGVRSANYSPDGKHIVTASSDKTARVWDLQGNLITELTGHQDSVNSANYSPDGKHIVTASSDKTARVWDLQGNLITELTGHQDSVNSANYSPDGKHIVTASSDKTARVWDLQGNLITELTGHQDSVNSANYSPDSKHIVTASSDKTARIWDLNGKLMTELTGHRDSVNSANYSPDGKHIVTASSDKTARIWDLQGNWVTELTRHQSGLRTANYSPDGKHVVTALDNNTARVWDLQGNLITELKGHQGWGLSASYSPDGKHIVTASGDNTARIWSLQGNWVTELKGHQAGLRTASYSPDGQHIVTASSDNTARIWDLKGDLITELKGHQDEVWSANYSPDGKHIVTASSDKTACIWDLQGNLITELTGHQDSVNSARYSPDGKHIVTTSRDRTARVWDLKGDLITELKGHQDSVWTASYSPDGKHIVTTSRDKTARVWDLQGNLITELKGHQDRVNGASYSPDGKHIVTASSDKTARVWNLQGNLVTELTGHQSGLRSASYSPDGKHIIIASADNTARVWDLKGSLVTELKGHQGEVWSASYSPDGKHIVTASADKTARIWPVQDLDQLLARGCNWLHDYLASTPDSVDDLRQFCGVKRSVASMQNQK